MLATNSPGFPSARFLQCIKIRLNISNIQSVLFCFRKPQANLFLFKCSRLAINFSNNLKLMSDKRLIGRKSEQLGFRLSVVLFKRTIITFLLSSSTTEKFNQLLYIAVSLSIYDSGKFFSTTAFIRSNPGARMLLNSLIASLTSSISNCVSIYPF